MTGPPSRPVSLRYRSALLEQQKASLQQVIDQSTRSLARFFLEIDANYKQFKTASRLRAAAAQRLEAQRAFYEEGRITIDRYFDSVSQSASAVAQEAQFKTTYNIALIALEEAKGTLLEHDRIVIAERSPAMMPSTVKRDGAAKTASHEVTDPRVRAPWRPFGSQAPAQPVRRPRTAWPKSRWLTPTRW